MTSLRTAGDIESVSRSRPALPTGRPSRDGARQIRMDLGRLDALMKQVGELVVAQEPSGRARRAGSTDPDLGRGERSDLPAGVGSMQAEVIAARHDAGG